MLEIIVELAYGNQFHRYAVQLGISSKGGCLLIIY